MESDKMTQPPKPEHIRVSGKFDDVLSKSEKMGLPLWFVTNGELGKDMVYDIFFVNKSDEVLTIVESGGGGFQTIDDDAVMSVGGPKFRYENVLPGEAVKIETYDIVYDSDFLLQLTVTIKSPRLGTIVWREISKGCPTGIILWEDGSLDRSARRVEEAVQ
jgi:hypothetical protein